MKIKNFFAAINIDIKITIRPDGVCQASGCSCEIQEGMMLISEWGSGSTPNKALLSYAHQISGRRLIVNAWDKANRKEYDVPILVPKPKTLLKKKKVSKKKKTSGS
jgi:hypothetical protein